MARNEQLIRQHKLLQLLEHSKFGLRLEELRDQLVEALGLTTLSERTVRRDLEALQAGGFDVDAHDSSRGAVWKLGPRLQGAQPFQFQATATELLSLAVGRQLLAPLHGTPFWQGVESLWQRMRESLPATVWEHFDKQWESVYVVGTPEKSYADHQGMVHTINRAILQNRVLEIVYQSKEQAEPRPREVEPYLLAFYKGGLYLVAAPHPGEADSPYKHYKLDRFHKATALDRYFKPREDFDAKSHFEGSLGIYKAGELATFHIRLDDEVVPWVSESPWHPQQELFRRDRDQTLLVVPSAYEDEILPRVLSLQDKAEILRPEASRRRMQEVVAKVLSLYAEAPGEDHGSDPDADDSGAAEPPAAE